MDVTLSLLLGRIRKAFRHQFESRAAPWDLTVPQFVVLKRLWQSDGIRTALLAHDAGADSGALTGILNRLEARGLITRRRCEEDRRVVRIHLTHEGRALEPPIIALVASLNEMALHGFTPEERDALVQSLYRIGDNLGDE